MNQDNGFAPVAPAKLVRACRIFSAEEVLSKNEIEDVVASDRDYLNAYRRASLYNPKTAYLDWKKAKDDAIAANDLAALEKIGSEDDWKKRYAAADQMLTEAANEATRVGALKHLAKFKRLAAAVRAAADAQVAQERATSERLGVVYTPSSAAECLTKTAGHYQNYIEAIESQPRKPRVRDLFGGIIDFEAI